MAPPIPRGGEGAGEVSFHSARPTRVHPVRSIPRGGQHVSFQSRGGGEGRSPPLSFPTKEDGVDPLKSWEQAQ